MRRKMISGGEQEERVRGENEERSDRHLYCASSSLAMAWALASESSLPAPVCLLPLRHSSRFLVCRSDIVLCFCSFSLEEEKEEGERRR